MEEEGQALYRRKLASQGEDDEDMTMDLELLKKLVLEDDVLLRTISLESVALVFGGVALCIWDLVFGILHLDSWLAVTAILSLLNLMILRLQYPRGFSVKGIVIRLNCQLLGFAFPYLTVLFCNIVGIFGHEEPIFRPREYVPMFLTLTGVNALFRLGMSIVLLILVGTGVLRGEKRPKWTNVDETQRFIL